MPRASGGFKVTDMHEETYAERRAGKLTRAGGDQAFDGDISGSGNVEWLMAYRDGGAEFVGLQQIEGSLDGKHGSFVLTSVGAYDGGAQESTGAWSVIAGSGTDELAGITGSGSWKAARGPNGTYELDYELS
jgi:Protein of unknown function (DUF3224)